MHKCLLQRRSTEANTNIQDDWNSNSGLRVGEDGANHHDHPICDPSLDIMVYWQSDSKIGRLTMEHFLFPPVGVYNNAEYIFILYLADEFVVSVSLRQVQSIICLF